MYQMIFAEFATTRKNRQENAGTQNAIFVKNVSEPAGIMTHRTGARNSLKNMERLIIPLNVSARNEHRQRYSDITGWEIMKVIVSLGDLFADSCSICGERACWGVASKHGPDGCVEAVRSGEVYCEKHIDEVRERCKDLLEVDDDNSQR